jgi:iron(III) transport system substrate-binding protein
VEVSTNTKAEVRMHSRLSKRAIFALTVVPVALAAFVGSSISSAKTVPANPLKPILAQVAGMKVAAREDKLHQLAVAGGGQVSVYTSLSALVVTAVKSAWAAEYPDVTLNLYRGSSEDVSARFRAETSAGTQGADIVETNGTTMLIYQHQKNMLVPYRGSPFAMQIPAKYRFDTFTADRREKFVVAWNTSLVKTPPTSFQQLADPAWKGKLSMEPTDADWYAGVYNYFSTQATPKMTGTQVDDMFKKIAANSQFINGHTNQATALAAGQVQVVVTGHAQAMEQLQAKGAPIAFAPFVTPVFERPQGIGIPYLTPHPAAALLFYDWLLRGKTADGKPAGQAVLQANGVEPANPYYPDNAFASNPLTVELDIRPIVANWQAVLKHYGTIVGTSS